MLELSAPLIVGIALFFTMFGWVWGRITVRIVPPDIIIGHTIDQLVNDGYIYTVPEPNQPDQYRLIPWRDIPR